MSGFNPNKVQWSPKELEAAEAADQLWEAIAAFMKEHPKFGVGEVVMLLASLAKEFNAVYKVVQFLFKAETIPQNRMRFVLDRSKDLLVMLERDNDWLDSREVG